MADPAMVAKRLHIDPMRFLMIRSQSWSYRRMLDFGVMAYWDVALNREGSIAFSYATVNIRADTH